MLRIVTSTSAAARLDARVSFLQSHPSPAEVVIVGASRGAADDLARAAWRPSTARPSASPGFSLTELAARSAATRLAGARRVPGTQAGAEATAARAVFDAMAAGELEYFEPVARMPGFPKALARTLHELRLAGVDRGRSGETRQSGAVRRCRAACSRASRSSSARPAIDDRAALFRLAAAACARRAGRAGRRCRSCCSTCRSIRSAEREFVAALVERSPDVLATVPDGDESALAARSAASFRRRAIEIAADPAPAGDRSGEPAPLHLHDRAPGAAARAAGDVRLFSAPGEGREAVEIVRRVLDEAARGVPFDEMAVFLRTPQQYLGLLEHACARGDVPVYFDRGTRRPDPAGRAFVALLSCAADGLSAKRFDEYLSLGQVPRVGESAANEARLAEPVAAGRRDVRRRFEPGAPTRIPSRRRRRVRTPTPARRAPPPDTDDEAIVAGTLRSPWKWEELIVESAVVGGPTRADGKARWRRRLDGLAADYRYRIEELKREEPESPRSRGSSATCGTCRTCASSRCRSSTRSPTGRIAATWGEWLDRFDALAARALRAARRACCRCSPSCGRWPPSVRSTLEEARDVLHDRLVDASTGSRRRAATAACSSARRIRRAAARFRVVFVPGLAERVVPQRPREDPLLLDDSRRGARCRRWFGRTSAAAPSGCC